MMKTASVAAVIALALIPVTAHAELPNGAMITFDELKIRENGNGFTQPSTPDALRHYLNFAHCVCAQAGAGMETSVQYLVRSSADTGTNKPVEFWVGTQCEDETQRPMKCRQVGTLPDIDLLVTQPARAEFDLFDVIMGGADSAIPETCTPTEGTRSVYTLVDADGDGVYDYTEGQPFATTTDVTRIDSQAPPLATDFVGASAENAIRLSWDPPETPTDIYAYQALCAKADGTPARSSRSHAPRYDRVVDLCKLDTNAITVTSTPLDSTDETPSTIPAAMAALDPSFICGEVTSSTATELLIEGLENDVAYSIVLVSVDQAGNAAGVSFDKTVTPRVAYDFWEDLHNRGSNVEGGFCLTGGQSPGGTAGPLALALGWLLVRRRRRDARVFARVAPIAVLALVAFGGVRIASAQGTTPYWEEQQEEDARLADEDVVKWHVGIRLGPYTPDIDKQFGMDPGPYNEMFGGYQILPVLDIDRIVWRGFGQLGFGGSLGYMQKSANAWAEAMPGEDRIRSTGDENTFRLIPLAATAVYRFTWLDDNYGIPVVPYIRGGLSYYVWWMRTNGKTSKACWDGSDTPDCDADKAYGATIGVQGSIGIAVRAERVDSAAATSMRAGGIEHAGFYGELSLAKVDGFGSDYKLSVGDATWFAGVNFEF